MVRQFKFALLGIVIIAAVATPGGDVVPQIAMAVPMVILYWLSVGLAWLFGKKKRTESDSSFS
jgi:sec-independent protein translocase protein TatC